MLNARPSEETIDVARIAAVLGAVPRVSYEAPHVYPLSAPDFAPAVDARRTLPVGEPLKLYVHVPFCNYACNFCFYAKQVRAGRPRMERYVAALVHELGAVAAGTPLAQLYVGGGTPTVLPADLLGGVLAAIDARMPGDAGTSRTVEASPESLTADHVRALRAHGVERVSLGVETLDATLLRAINRRHTREQARDAVEELRAAGLVVNVDLMYGFPGQSEASFVADLTAVAGWGVPSISVYNLRLNEHTPLARIVGDLERLDLAHLVGWRALIRREMEALGFVQTRWHTFVDRRGVPSTFGRAPCVDGSQPGRQLGIGVSAVSHLGGTVYRNHEHIDGYLERIERDATPVDGTFSLDGEDRRTLLVARTLGDGRPLARADWRAAFGHEVEADFGDLLSALTGAGLIADDADEIALTETGRLVYDLVTLAFYPTRARQWLRSRQPSTNGSARHRARQ
jgi:oxygen-independent coproporphyrinogen-3 oxidase